MKFDVLLVGDLRFPGGTSTSLAADARALSEAGYRMGVISLASRVFPARRKMHPEIETLIKDGTVELVPPGTEAVTELCCLHHPRVFETFPARGLRIRARQTVLIVHHPPLDADGVPQYKMRDVQGVLGDLFGDVLWAPVGPKVRSGLEQLDAPPPMTNEDWTNCIDPSAYEVDRDLFVGTVPVVGRHSRPAPVKWPSTREDFLEAYPDAPDIRVRLMGYSTALDDIIGPRPANWETLPFGALSVPEFLGSLDYFSYFHGPSWIEGFGRAPLEAMAAGLVCFLPPDFEPIFGDAAIFCAPGEVAEKVRQFQADPESYRTQSKRARALVTDRFGPHTVVKRVRARIGAPRAVAHPAAPPTGTERPRVLFVTSNGIGLGHLTRCMASARRLKPTATPIIVTMSRAFGVVQDEGMMVEYLPYFRSVGLEHPVWEHSLRRDFRDILGFYRPQVIVFDGNVPYMGMLDALKDFPEIWRVWQRRGLWRPGMGVQHVKRESHFDVVIEPGEIAAPMDRGPTATSRGRTLALPPVRFLRQDEALSRKAARTVLGLADDRPAILLQLGSGNNFATREIGLRVWRYLTERPVEQAPAVVLAQWRISDNTDPWPEEIIRLTSFPFARFLNAFDGAVALAGYNTFHENIAAGLPTLFLSNENPEHDEQHHRAEFGAMRGLCLAARSHDRFGILRGLDMLLDYDRRKAMREACRTLPAENGADLLASYLGHLAYAHKPHAIARWRDTGVDAPR